MQPVADKCSRVRSSLNLVIFLTMIDMIFITKIELCWLSKDEETDGSHGIFFFNLDYR